MVKGHRRWEKAGSRHQSFNLRGRKVLSMVFRPVMVSSLIWVS